jgi:hypothetical protein
VRLGCKRGRASAHRWHARVGGPCIVHSTLAFSRVPPSGSASEDRTHGHGITLTKRAMGAPAHSSGLLGNPAPTGARFSMQEIDLGPMLP